MFLILIALTALGTEPGAPLHKAAVVPLPGSATRFDYQSLDPATGRLYISHMGAGHLVIFDTKTDKVIDDLPDYRRVTGVLAVPQEGKLYASAAGSHEVVVADLETNQVLARVPGALFPDGIAYAPEQRRVFVSDESGGIDLVLDGRTDKAIKSIDLGGEAGNTHFDPVTGKIWVAVQTKNEMVAIDPEAMTVTGRYELAGSEEPHGWTSLDGVAYISCEGNDKLLVADLKTMAVSQSFATTPGPDVLVVDAGLRRLYVACEGGALDVYQIGSGGKLSTLGKFEAPRAHTVAVDPETHRVYLALEDVDGRPELWILEPGP